jgi:hypothetical protein
VCGPPCAGVYKAIATHAPREAVPRPILSWADIGAAVLGVEPAHEPTLRTDCKIEAIESSRVFHLDGRASTAAAASESPPTKFRPACA